MKKRILIVDDKETIAKLVAMYLSEFDFVYFDNPIKAISWLHEGNLPELIISDIRMPEMMGDEFLSYLKNNELFKSIPVVMLSAEDSSSARIKLLESGAADYIVKPFNPMELKIRITRLLA